MQNKVLITCAVTGSVHTPTMSEHLPITPDEITEQSLDAAKAGAAILHLHARDPATGQPTADPDIFMQFLPRWARIFRRSLRRSGSVTNGKCENSSSDCINAMVTPAVTPRRRKHE
ncbi:MAG: 3-keto-5-aminohexanoate cleavage protein [Proteobacteria bacterium]|nr:3-keto-5-aminohexanoate cleavage protein [Pseudomonadota bacterium]